MKIFILQKSVHKIAFNICIHHGCDFLFWNVGLVQLLPPEILLKKIHWEFIFNFHVLINVQHIVIILKN